MNVNLLSLNKAIKDCVDDPTVSVNDIASEIKNSLSIMCLTLKAKAEKASKVADFVKDVDYLEGITGGLGEDKISLNIPSSSFDNPTFL